MIDFPGLRVILGAMVSYGILPENEAQAINDTLAAKPIPSTLHEVIEEINETRRTVQRSE